MWTEISHKKETSRTPALVFREDSLVAKLIRDLLTDHFTAIRIDDNMEYGRILDLVQRIMPEIVTA